MTNLTNIKKWVAALRSGEYEQGKAMLKDAEGRMCCLGVATDVYLNEFGYEWGEPVPLDGSIPRVGCKFDGEGEYLPVPVQEWLGLNEKNPAIVPIANDDGVTFHEDEATYFNDESGMTFEQIADAIENTYITGRNA